MPLKTAIPCRWQWRVHLRVNLLKWAHMGGLNKFNQDDLGGFWTWLPLEKSVTEEAAELFITLSEQVFLCSSDCLHLVTALHYRFQEVYTYDAHQRQACSVFGLTPVIA